MTATATTRPTRRQKREEGAQHLRELRRLRRPFGRHRRLWIVDRRTDLGGRRPARSRDANPAVAIQVDGPGTGDGFAKFCAGETDISDASRPIRAEEVEACEASGIEFVELKIAIDGLSVITSTNNADAECLAFSDLYALLGPDATGVDNWSGATSAAEANAGTLGTSSAPATPPTRMRLSPSPDRARSRARSTRSSRS